MVGGGGGLLLTGPPAHNRRRLAHNRRRLAHNRRRLVHNRRRLVHNRRRTVGVPQSVGAGGWGQAGGVGRHVLLSTVWSSHGSHGGHAGPPPFPIKDPPRTVCRWRRGVSGAAMARVRGRRPRPRVGPATTRQTRFGAGGRGGGGAGVWRAEGGRTPRIARWSRRASALRAAQLPRALPQSPRRATWGWPRTGSRFSIHGPTAVMRRRSAAAGAASGSARGHATAAVR